MSYLRLEVGLHDLSITSIEGAVRLADAIKRAVAATVEGQGVVIHDAYTDSSVTVELIESAGLQCVRSE